KKLATICIDCDVTFNATDYELTMPDGEKVQEIFEELEFRRLKDQFLKLFSDPSDESVEETQKESKGTVKKEKATSAGSGQFSLFGNEGEASSVTIQEYSSRTNIDYVPHVYQSILPGMAMTLFIKNLIKQTSVCFDTETTGLNPLTAELVGIAFSWEAGKGFYLPFPEDKTEAQKIIEQLRPFFESEQIEKIGQNLKYDIKVLHKYQITIKGKCFDTMLAHYLINPDMRHNMDVLAETYLNYTPVPI